MYSKGWISGSSLHRKDGYQGPVYTERMDIRVQFTPKGWISGSSLHRNDGYQGPVYTDKTRQP